jgi:hypothetical protein
MGTAGAELSTGGEIFLVVKLRQVKFCQASAGYKQFRVLS